MQTSIATDNNLEKSRMKLEDAGAEELHIKLPQAPENTNVSTQHAKSPPGLRGSAAPSDRLNGAE